MCGTCGCLITAFGALQKMLRLRNFNKTLSFSSFPPSFSLSFSPFLLAASQFPLAPLLVALAVIYHHVIFCWSSIDFVMHIPLKTMKAGC